MYEYARMKKQLIPFLVLGLAACDVKTIDQHPPATPAAWSATGAAKLKTVDAQALKDWWKQFDDPTLNWLIDTALKNSPDVNIAAARISEARGVERTADAALYPQVNGGGVALRSKLPFLPGGASNNYNGFFDATYELDLFGKNREAANASTAAATAATNDYDWVKLSMIAEVTRTYVMMRAAEKQVALAKTDLGISNNTLSLVTREQKAGGVSDFDVKRTGVQVHQSAAQIADYKRQRETYAMALVTLTGLTAPELMPHLKETARIPGIGLKPLTLAPAAVLSQRPDIAAANARFTQATSLKNSAAADVFPDITLGGLLGLGKSSGTNATTMWAFGAQATVSLLDFGRIQGQIDSASAREVQAYETWRKAILQAMQDVDTAIAGISRTQEQRNDLNQAKESAAAAVNLAKVRYRAGDEALLDVLDAQRQRIETDRALVEAEASYATSVVALYKALGQY